MGQRIDKHGAVAYNTKEISANYTMTLWDYQIRVTANSPVITCVSARGIKGRRFAIQNTGAGTPSLAFVLSQTMLGETSQTVRQWSNLEFESNGENWIIV